jgi:hypothetical protein
MRWRAWSGDELIKSPSTVLQAKMRERGQHTEERRAGRASGWARGYAGNEAGAKKRNGGRQEGRHGARRSDRPVGGEEGERA